MAKAVLMPKSGISVESCIIGTWKKKVGDSVAVGDILFDYETDKAAFECESTADGVILEIFFHDGDEVEVLKPVCAVGAEGEDVSAIREEAGAPATSSAAVPQDGELVQVVAPQDGGLVQAEEPLRAAEADTSKISPRARYAANRLGLYTGEAVPSGPNGRIIERDVTALAASAGASPTESAEEPRADAFPVESGETPEAGESPPIGLAGPYSDEKLSKIRTLIASSMHGSLQNSAQLTHHHSFDATEVQAVRKAFKENPNPAIANVSIGDMVLFAVTRALTEHPGLNAHLVGEDTLRRFENVNLGVAVDTPRGLMVPTVFGAEGKSLIELSAEVKRLAEAARRGNIAPDLLQGGTFTVSNLGTTGVEMFTPILNPPQVGIFGVCGVTTKVRRTDGGMEAYPSIGMSLTYDHRAIDGAPASRFAQAVCEKLSQFSLLLDI